MRIRPARILLIVLLFLLGAQLADAELVKRSDEDSSGSVASKDDSVDCDCDAEDEDEGPWSGSVSLGVSASVGEDEVATVSADLNAAYDARPHHLDIGLTGFYSIENGENNANRQYGQIEYRYYLRDQFYGYGSTSAERNLQQSLRFRSATTVGPGYQFLDRNRPHARIVKKDSASIQMGAGYQYQRLSTVGEREVDQNFVLQATGTYSLTFPHKITWGSRLTFTVPPGDFDLWRFLGDTTLNVPIVGTLGLQARLTVDYLNGPVLESRGGRKLTFFGSLGVSYSF